MLSVAPREGYEIEEKDTFWMGMDEEIQDISRRGMKFRIPSLNFAERMETSVMKTCLQNTEDCCS